MMSARIYTLILTVMVMAGLPALQVKAQPGTDMDRFIDGLMQQMTIEEKIGQLNLVTAGEVTTGWGVSTGVGAKIKEGKIGGIFSMTKPNRIRSATEPAVRQSPSTESYTFCMDGIR